MKITDNTLIKLFLVGNTKMKRGWDIPFFNFIKAK